jgi:hypothetical protein
MRILAAILFTALALPANATFHLWYINEVYSNADGSVQYIEMKAAAAGQQFIRGHSIRTSSGGSSNSYTFPNDLPGDSAEGGGGDPYGYGGSYGGETIYKTFLIATQGFAALNIVAPDFVVPNGFIFRNGGVINFGEGASTFTHGALPTDNRALSNDRTPQSTSPMNFAGAVASVPAGNPANSASTSYQGLWLGPNATESGWGINFTHQGSVLFATWFTYGSDGAMWLVMSNGAQTAAGRFSGDLYRTTGPGFNADPFTAIGASNYTPVGTLSVTFSDADNGSMTYTVNGVTQTKAISRYVYTSPVPTCELGGSAGASPNYGDLWYRSEAESGWGVNIVHQGDILFATWFTYEAGGSAASPAKGMWLVMSNGGKTANNTYSGALQRTTGPNAFSASSAFDPNQVQRTTVGDATFTFSDANTGTFRYTVNGVTQTKPIQRLRIAAPATVCR